MNIGIDLDGVLVNSIPYWVRVLNREAGASFHTGEFPDTSADLLLAACEREHELEMVVAPPPMGQAVPVLTHLRALGHRLVVISGRSERLRRLTEAWLDYHGVTVHALRFVGAGSKAPMAIDEGIDVMLEDHPRHVLDLCAAGVPILLFDTPYNRTLGDQIRLTIRCHGWADIQSQIATMNTVDA